MEDPWDSKPSKIQTFFQISVTALAFLAFAGYLLCMIVQAIKTKGKNKKLNSVMSQPFCKLLKLPGTMYSVGYTNAANAGSINTMNSLMNTGSVPLLRKRRPVGRRKRNVLLSADNRNETISSIYQQAFATPDLADMYNVMIQCAEGYTKFYFVK